MGKKIISPLVFKFLALLLVVSLFGLIEISLRLIIPEFKNKADQLRVLTSQDIDRQSSVIKQPDPYLLWKLKPGCQLYSDEKLNKHGFRGPDFSISRSTSISRILCLGDSRTFGFGINKHQLTFPGLLQEYTQSQKLEKDYEVINLGTIGYSSFQALRLLETLGWELNPKIIIVWFGFNDTLFFHLTDKEAALKSPALGKLRSVANRFFTYHLMRKFYNNVTRSQNTPVQLDQRIVRRVPLNEYRNIMNRISTIAKDKNIQIIFMTTPIRPKIPMVLNAKLITGKTDNGIPTERLQAQYELDGYWLMNAREFPGNETELDRLLEKYPNLPILHYFKSIFLSRKGMNMESLAEAEIAAALDTERKIIAKYNSVLKSIASENVTVIDLIPGFKKYDDITLFVDDCHPNSNGHKLITSKLIKEIFNRQISVKTNMN